MEIIYGSGTRTVELQGIVGNLALIYLEPVGIVRIERTKLEVKDGTQRTGRQTSETQDKEACSVCQD